MGTTKAHGKIPYNEELSRPAHWCWRRSPEPVQPRLPPLLCPSRRSGCALGACGKVGWGSEAALLVRRRLGAAAGLVPVLWVQAELWSSPGSPSLEAGCLK